MLTVVTFLWKPFEGYRSQFKGEHVDVLARMVRRNLSVPHRFVCITDDPSDITEKVDILPLWSDHAEIPSPHDRKGKHNPSCYRRLKIFARDAADWLGTRILSLDLDCVITGSLDELVARPEDFVIWGETNATSPYNGSMVLLTAGARPQVWESFDRETSPAASFAAGYFGSDQGWIAYCLGPHEARFRADEGVLSYRLHVKRGTHGNRLELPRHARVVFFHGEVDPWSPEAQRLDWVREHWR
jgi:hypothetical protein